MSGGKRKRKRRSRGEERERPELKRNPAGRPDQIRSDQSRPQQARTEPNAGWLDRQPVDSPSQSNSLSGSSPGWLPKHKQKKKWIFPFFPSPPSAHQPGQKKGWGWVAVALLHHRKESHDRNRTGQDRTERNVKGNEQ